MSSRLKVHLVIIDPQNDFCDIPESECPLAPTITQTGGRGTATAMSPRIRPTLPVPGSHADMSRIATMITRVGHKLDDIHVTMDSHRLIDVAHPAMWMDQHGNQPAPFTFITDKDIEAGIWAPRNPAFRARMLAYTKSLEATGKYVLCIWPAHCLIGTWGHNIHAEVNAALQKWSADCFAMVDYVTKGSNVWTEHYGAIMAEVPDPSDPGTSLNTSFLSMLAEADIIAVCGEASSHCVKNTVVQIAENIGDQHLKKFHLLTDGMSPVGAVRDGSGNVIVDFPGIAKQWIADMRSKYGMTLTTTTDFLA